MSKSELKRLFALKGRSITTAHKSTIVVNNSYSKLENFPVEIVEKVKAALTYENTDVKKEKQRIFMSMNMAKRSSRTKLYYALKAQLEELPPEMTCWLMDFNQFPTGLLYLVSKTLDLGGFEGLYSIFDARVRPDPYLILRWANTPPEMRYYQKDMIMIASEKERGVFNAATGTGKSLLYLNLIKQKEVNTLVILPSLALLDQTYTSFVKYLGPKAVQIVDSAAVKKKKKLAPIRLCSVQTLVSLQKTGIIQDAIRDIDMVIMDEVHHFGSETATNLMLDFGHIYYKYGGTATFLRNDSRTMDLHGVLSNVLYTYPPAKAIEEGYITPVHMKIITVPGNPKSNYQKEYDINYCGSQVIMNAIKNVIGSIPGDEQILILVNRKEKSGEIIHEYLKRLKIENTYISGDDKKEVIGKTVSAYNDCKIRILIASTVIGEGVDVTSVKNLIYARGGKSEIEYTQAVGRAVRLYPGKKKAYIYEFLFTGTRFLEKHLRTRIEIFQRQFAGTIIKELAK